MLPNKKYTPAAVLQVLKTRGVLLVVPTALGLLVALVLSSRLPDLYQAETLIQIVPQRVPDSYVRSTVTLKAEDRLEALGAQVKSRTQLEKMITELDLYRKERALQPMQDVVEKMRSSIETQTVRPSRIEPVDAFYIRFKYEDPAMAARVTERLGMLYIDYNARERGALAQGTNEFLGTQLADAKKRLEEADEKLKTFRERHSGKLPSQLQSNMQAIQTKQSERQALVESLARDRDRKQMLELMYSDKLATPVPAPPVAFDPGANSPTAATTLSPRQQLDRARANLSTLQAKLSDEHPDLRRARRQVAELEKQVAALPPETGPSLSSATVSPLELQRQEQITAMRAEIESLGRQIAFKESEDRRLGAIIADYQSRIEAVPGVESDYLKLSRDYETIQETFKDLLTKSEAARVAENLESRQIGEQFRVLDPPRVPLRPISPQRAQISGGGLLAGLVVGLIVVALLEVRDGSFKTTVDIAEVLKLPVVAIVPAYQSVEDQVLRKRRRLLLSGAAALMVIGTGYTVWTMRLWQFVM